MNARQLLVLMVGGAFAVAGATGCKKPEATAQAAPKEDPPVHVTLATAAQRPMPEFLTLTGTLSANQQSDVAADAVGKVLRTYVERGQQVHKGDPLATLDARSASLSAQAAAANSEMAKTQLDLAQRDCERGQHLFDTGAISKAEYDRTMAQCNGQKFSAAAAQANSQAAAKTLGDSTIRAPFDGFVGERSVNVGQYVQANTKVVTLFATDPLRVELTVPESNVASVKIDMPVDFRVTAFGDQDFKGTVRFISPNVRVSSRDLVIEAVVPNADGKLRPGMFATARLLLGMHDAVAIPLTAVKKDESTGAAHLFVAKDARAEERIVQLGDDQDGMVSVTNGLKAGESVVDNPPADVKDGSKLDLSPGPTAGQK